MTLLRKIAAVLGIAFAVLALVVIANTLRQESRQLDVPPAPRLALDESAAAARLGGGVRIVTVSRDDTPDGSAAGFRKLHAYLERQYPRAHAVLKREVVNGYSLLYTWPGADAARQGVLLMAHQDVVPVDPHAEAKWEAPPFSGAVRDGFIWGRGAWDDKSNLFAMLEAVELLAAKGFRPARTVYFAFGHDEELGGARGAHAIVQRLKSRGVRLEFVLDEGLVITEGILSGIDKPVALIGTAEKGYFSVSLSLAVASGHSSAPPARSAIGRVGAALARLESEPMPAGIRGATREMFDTLAPEMGGLNRVLLSNLWLFEPIVKQGMARNASTNAMIRSTAAVTIIRAGDKDNVLPGQVDAVVNFRVLPGDTIEQCLAHAERRIDDDDIRLQMLGIVSEPSRVSPADAPSYRLLARTIREVLPGTIVAPALLVARTDSRYMEEIAGAVYRFSPIRARQEDLQRFHGTNERISVADYADMIRFYHRLLLNAAGTT